MPSVSYLSSAYQWTSDTISGIKNSIAQTKFAEDRFGINIETPNTPFTIKKKYFHSSKPNDSDNSTSSETIGYSNDSNLNQFEIETVEKDLQILDLLKNNCPSLVSTKVSRNSAEPEITKSFFVPSPTLPLGDLQTMYISQISRKQTPMDIVKYDRELFKTQDGGTVSIDWAPPLSEVPIDNRPVVFILHGLSGGSHEYYVRAVTRMLTSEQYNFRVIVMNARGCSRTPVTSPRLYNASYTNDFRLVVNNIKQRLPGSVLFGVGFSLGSNVLVKYVGEEGENCPLTAAISVCNPFDLRKSSEYVQRPTLLNKYVYEPNLARGIMRSMKRHYDVLSTGDFTEKLDKLNMKSGMRDIDDLVATVFGYESRFHYYEEGSSKNFLDKVKVPLLCINSMDDPVCPPECIPKEEFSKNPHLVLALTNYGGHLGFFEGIYPEIWYKKPIAEFFKAIYDH
ncbi:hypothetical protein BB558_001162 [Smittium angustum]|uniref:AB hydrolase-1 domain-containing protein n=1 Tax=Smittium angustum TaxID=133377 RepID=A0A2U1IWU1_SMIAN|nr:hypothetical protein BB558_006764 [Smittium angustum]PWA02702.1 hypothetical protein BB558_001162 [Smittium angustum]